MTESEIDALVFRTIQTIESYQDPAFRSRIKTVVSFLKGAEKSPFYHYFAEHKDLCGKATVSLKSAEAACLRLCDRNLIVKRAEKGKVTYFETTKLDRFTDRCTKEERMLIDEIENWIKHQYPFMRASDRKNRYAFYDSRIASPDGIDYAWMWFTFRDLELIFRYKLSAADRDKAVYEGNQIAANAFHKKTITNLIDLILQQHS